MVVNPYRDPAPKRSRGLFRPLAIALAASLLMSVSAQALVIQPVFDNSIASLANASTVEAAFNAAAADYAQSFSAAATVYVGVSWGSVDGYALPSNALGASVDQLYGYFSYSQIRSYLTSDSIHNPSDTALASAVANLPRIAPSGPSRYVIPSAEARALGLIPGNYAAYDGFIGFSGNSLTSYDYNPTNGITSGTYDFEAVAAHEIDEVLGRISGLTGSNSTYRTPLDLLRYSAPGTLSFSYNAAAYLSVDGGKMDLGNFNNSSYGGDRSDWLTLSTSRDVQDAFLGTGTAMNLTAADLTALDAIGWGGLNAGDNWTAPTTVAFNLVDTAVPEPASLTLFASGLLGLGVIRRRKKA